MKKLALLVALVLAFSLSVLAQGTSATGTQESQTTTTTKSKKAKKGEAKAGETAGATKEHQLTGCLSKDPSGTGFLLTNGRHKKGVEVKSSEDLSAHVGHEVKLTGTWEKAAAAGEAGAAEKGAAKGKEMRTFNATALQHISDTCSAAGKAGKASKKGKGEAGEAAPKSEAPPKS